MKRGTGKFWAQATPIPGAPDLDSLPDKELHSPTHQYTWRGPKVLVLETREPSAEPPEARTLAPFTFPSKPPAAWRNCNGTSAQGNL